MSENEVSFEVMQSLQDRIKRHKFCKGRGYVKLDDGVEYCECRKDALFEYRLIQSGIPAQFRKKGFKDFVHTDSEAYKKVQDYLKYASNHRTDGMGLFLYGPGYTGKTLLSTSLLMELIRQNFDVKFFYFGGLLNAKDTTGDQLSKQWDFLCIDGVGEVLNNLTNFRHGVLTDSTIHGAVEFLCGILASRINSGRPVIITSSVSLSTINEKFPNLASTLIGNCIAVQCEDKGFKQKKLEQMMD